MCITWAHKCTTYKHTDVHCITKQMDITWAWICAMGWRTLLKCNKTNHACLHHISTPMHHTQACTCVLYNKTDGHHVSTYAYTCTSHTYRWPCRIMYCVDARLCNFVAYWPWRKRHIIKTACAISSWASLYRPRRACMVLQPCVEKCRRTNQEVHFEE